MVQSNIDMKPGKGAYKAKDPEFENHAGILTQQTLSATRIAQMKTNSRFKAVGAEKRLAF